MEAATLKHNSDIRQKNVAGTGVPFFKPSVQPKLSINEPGDHFEHEADAMADKVMRMTDTSANQNSFFKPANNIVQRKCKACEEEEKHVHRKESNTGAVEGSNALQSYVSSLSSSGQSMSATSRSFFEPRFGHDFSNVKIHTDSVAAKSAQSINALAYTSGNNIVFNSDQYSPESDKGKTLMAHELTHVVQQQSGASTGIQRMLACPAHLNDNDPVPAGFKNYFGSTSVFHCGFRTILEDRAPTPTDPMNECVYDHSGVLVTDSHKYSGCQGTPDQYDSQSDSWNHTWHDTGGIWHAGAPALGSTIGHLADEAVDTVTQPFADAYNWLDRGVKSIYGM